MEEGKIIAETKGLLSVDVEKEDSDEALASLSDKLAAIKETPTLRGDELFSPAMPQSHSLPSNGASELRVITGGLDTLDDLEKPSQQQEHLVGKLEVSMCRIIPNSYSC